MVRISSRQQLILSITIVVVLLLVLMLGFVRGKTSTLTALNQELVNKGDGLKVQLHSELKRLSAIVKIYADNPEIGAFVAANNSTAVNLKINKQLLEIALAAQALDIYVINLNGKVIAASNFDTPNSFIGNNFSFRSYVKQALSSGSGFELAVGVVSAKRGVYFSRAIRSSNHNEVIGVLVLKADVAAMEASEQLFPSEQPVSFMVLDSQQLIFLSDQPTWRLKTPQSFESLDQMALIDSDQNLAYKKNKLWQHLGYAVWQLKRQQLLVHQDKFEQFPWHIKVFANDTTSTKQGVLVASIMGISYIALISLLLFFRERRKNIVRLKLSHQRLTKQVALRTQDLTTTNAQLVAQVEQRKKAQADLIATQQQLIQSAKLATIGELSSSINHELNQPIAALSSYLQSTRKMLDKQLFEQVDGNITRMSQLLDRLIGIVSQFKNFSRKTILEPSVVTIDTIVDNAMVIVGHHVKKHRVTVNFNQQVSGATVLVEPIQLEQVIVNLLTNAVDALGDTVNPTIVITITGGSQVIVVIEDNGSGIEPHYLNQIFEPFFTTKSQTGLGLGLSISRRIIESFDGELLVENGLECGALFKIVLPSSSQIESSAKEQHV